MKDTNEFSRQEKLYMLGETFRMSEHELVEYCRTKGILASDLDRWEEEITEPVEDLTPSERISLIRENRRLEKEIKKIDKKLAEAAALLILSEKANKIWGVKK